MKTNLGKLIKFKKTFYFSHTSLNHIKPTMQQNDYFLEIKPQNKLFALNFKEVWQYRDLLRMFVRRNIVAQYKQTILGPLWLFLQPLFTSITMFVIFSKVAGLGTDGMPAILFYLAGNTAWNYFATCLNSTASTFTGNASIFGKVYFPRLISPLSVVVSNLFKFGIQFLIFLILIFYYVFIGEIEIFSASFLFFPVLLLLMAGLGMGIGLTISSLTTKYRDLTFFLAFGVQLFMYFTPVILPLQTFVEKMGDKAWIINLNPMTGIIVTYRNIFIGDGTILWGPLGYSATITIILLFIGIIVFNRTEKNFMDTV